MNACEIITKIDNEILVQPEDWQQGSFGLNEGPKCLLGALRYAITSHTYDFPRTVFERLEYDIVYESFMARASGNVATWNDKPGRTFDDVKALIKDVRKELCA